MEPKMLHRIIKFKKWKVDCIQIIEYWYKTNWKNPICIICIYMLIYGVHASWDKINVYVKINKLKKKERLISSISFIVFF